MLCKNDIEDDIGAYIIDRIPGVQMQAVFDVGANVGWWAYKFIQHYKDTEFFLFEPVTSLHDQIEHTLSTHAARHNPFPRVKTFRMALGDAPDVGRTTKLPNVTVNHLVSGTAAGNSETEEVQIETGDRFCSAHGIEHVNFLKIDCEGFDLKVLIGFRKLLERGAIDFVQVEASLSPDTRKLVPLGAFEGLLGMYGYQKFRVLNQGSDWNRPVLTRADVVFISSKAADRYSKPTA